MVCSKQNSNQTPFFIFYQTGALVNVSKKTFTKLKLPTLVFGDKKVKICRKDNFPRKKAKELLNKFFAEGFFQKGADIVAGITVLLNTLAFLGKAKNLVKKINVSLIVKVSLFLARLPALIENFSIFSAVEIVLSAIDLYLGYNSYKAESLDAIALASISYLMPTEVVDFIKKIQIFSNVKICDDTSMLYSFISSICDFVSSVILKLPKGNVIMDKIKSCLEWCNISTAHILLYRVEHICAEWDQVKNKVLTTVFSDKVKRLKEELDKSREISEWSKRSNVVSQQLQNFNRIFLIVRNNENVHRVEPSAFILEGPPGCGKSLASNQIIEALNLPVYSHSIKSVGDGKDFYDNYQNQDIFHMDDVGAQGISQWRSLINMVSSVKMPLECAQANLKDTKYFNSSIILLTTNNFKNLNGLTKTDCISDIGALHRRGYVFDFSNTRQGQNYNLLGEVSFNHFDISTNQWQKGIPGYIIKKNPSLKKIPSSIVLTPDSEREEFLGWVVAIIKGITKAKETISSGYQLSVEEKSKISEVANKYLSEGLLGNMWNGATSFDGDILNKASSFVDSMKEWVPSLSDISATFSKLCFSSQFFKDVCYEMLQSVIATLLSAGEFLWDMNCYQWGIVILSLLTFCVIWGIIKRFSKPKFKAENSPYENDLSTRLPRKIIKQVFDVEVSSMYGAQNLKALLSGHHLLLPYHSLIHATGVGVVDTYRVTIFGDKATNSILVDKEMVTVVFSDKAADVIVLSLPETFPTPFKNLSKFFQGDCKIINPLLVNNNGVLALTGYDFSHASGNVYSMFDWQNSFGSQDYQYKFRGSGLCGSLLVTSSGINNNEYTIVGMHVAGSSECGLGISKCWSSTVRSSIYKILSRDKSFTIPFLASNYKDDMSVARLRLDEEQMSVEEFRKIQTSVPTQSKLVTTPLYGIYPVTRFPANLTRTGKCTVKDVAKKSFGHVAKVNEDELSFASKCIDQIIPTYSAISEREVVSGNALLAGLNKDSSNGFGCLKNKTDYVDFENGQFKDFFRDEVANIEQQLEEGHYPWKTFVWTESLKDELRGVEKDGEPRSFRVGTIHSQALAKKYFGNMVEGILMNRWFNGIMVGINPFKDWPKLYDNLKPYRVFSADIKKWDGGMLPQVQRAVINAIVLKYEHKSHALTIKGQRIAKALLESLVHSILLVQDDLLLTTHSLPSGHFLTAIFNSLVNRFYTAMWYYRELSQNGVKPTVTGFFNDVVDYVYGDDKIVAIRKYDNLLNAKSCCKFFESIGLGLTTSDKKAIDFEFQDISQVDFLKRKFIFHSELNKIVGPLDLRTLYSGLSFASSDKVLNDVLADKLHNFQREIYLHENYEELLQDFYNRIDGKISEGFNIPFVRLPRSYLKFLYMDEQEMDKAFSLLYI